MVVSKRLNALSPKQRALVRVQPTMLEASFSYLKGTTVRLVTSHAGVSRASYGPVVQSGLEQRSHKAYVVGSNPTGSTYARVSQPAEETASKPVKWWFESTHEH